MRSLAAFASMAFLALPAALAEEAAKTDLDELKLGEHIYGPKVDLEDLKGRVILVEDWGLK
jgi:hypothetical protein